MAASLNLHRAFTGSDSYLARLEVPVNDAATLSAAREEIRESLRAAFQDWWHHFGRDELFDSAVVWSGAVLKLPKPKFRLQGSFKYGTANDCQQNPPQQIDQDDGVFVPVGFLATNSAFRPSIASKAYFSLVENALRPLCARNGWRLNPGPRPKATCVRVEIGPRVHIDLPLYAIRDEAFERLLETALAKSVTASTPTQDAALDLFDEVYRGLGDQEIMLAHRIDGWIASDPRKLEDWFDGALQHFGSQLGRLSRAYKGMRDADAPDSDLGSIAIMAGLVSALEALGPQDPNRDDLALLATAREMAEVFQHPVENPAFPDDETKNFCFGWSKAFRQTVCDMFSRAADELHEAIYGTVNKSVALNHVRSVFGDRVPTDTNLVTLVGSVATIIRSEPPQTRVQPMPVRTKSG